MKRNDSASLHQKILLLLIALSLLVIIFGLVYVARRRYTESVQFFPQNDTGASASNIKSNLSIRVVIFAASFLSVVDGVSLTLQRVIDRIRSNPSNRVLVVTCATADQMEKKELRDYDVLTVPFVPMPSKKQYPLSFTLPAEARRILCAWKPNILHLTAPDLLNQSAIKLSETNDCRIPILCTYHTHFPLHIKRNDLLSQLGRKYAWKHVGNFHARCDRVMVPSKSTVELLKQNYALTQNVVEWGRGVDSERFSPGLRSQEWRRAHRIAKNDVVILYVGRLASEKNLPLFSRVCNALTKRLKNIQIVLVGSGELDREMRRKMPNAIFTGHLCGTDLAIAYASSDVFFFPSVTESFGCVTLEAMGSGLPVVGSNAPGTKDLVRHNVNGFLCESEKEMQASLARLISDKTLRDSMARQSRCIATQSYDWSILLDQLMQSYDALKTQTKRRA